MNNIRPLRDFILVKKIKEEEKTESGLILASVARNWSKGVVMAVGPGKPGKDTVAPAVKAGDRVLFTEYITALFDDQLLLREDMILAVVDEA